MTTNKLTDERIVKILSETQATITEHNSRCVRGSVEVDARLFEEMLMELQERRKVQDKLESFRAAFMEYSNKTDWVQTDKRFDVLKPWGKHLADVLREFIEHLETKLSALAAENAGLKNSIEILEDICDAVVAEHWGLKSLIEQHAASIAVCPNCSHEEPSETDDIIALYRSMETPATDVFLAEVRAQGVEMFAEHLSGMSISASETSVREFAAQLRKGVQS